jgi:hypothetical protein
MFNSNIVCLVLREYDDDDLKEEFFVFTREAEQKDQAEKSSIELGRICEIPSPHPDIHYLLPHSEETFLILLETIHDDITANYVKSMNATSGNDQIYPEFVLASDLELALEAKVWLTAFLVVVLLELV